MNYFYQHDFGEAALPEHPPIVWPDRRFKICKQWAQYERYLNKLAEQKFLAGENLTVAPPFSEWVAA